jgi:hypothetical protein
VSAARWEDIIGGLLVLPFFAAMWTCLGAVMRRDLPRVLPWFFAAMAGGGFSEFVFRWRWGGVVTVCLALPQRQFTFAAACAASTAVAFFTGWWRNRRDRVRALLGAKSRALRDALAAKMPRPRPVLIPQHLVTALAEFVAARLDEDEAMAEAAIEIGLKRYGDRYHEEVGFDPGGISADDGWLVVDPARVLREVQAKRAILALHHPSPGLRHPVTDYHVDICAACDIPEPSRAEWKRIDGFEGSVYPCDTARSLAAAWSDHPDYDEAWRP